MQTTGDIIQQMQAEAGRCERIATGLSDPELIGRLTDWAHEYRRIAETLRNGRSARIAA